MLNLPSTSGESPTAADHMALALEILPVAVAIVRGSDEGILNAAAREILGVGDDVPFRNSDFPVRSLDGAPLAEHERVYAVAMRTGRRQSRRLRYARPDGAERVIDIVVLPLSDGSDGYVAVLTDVTDEHSEQVLNRQFLSQLFETLPIAISVLDAESAQVLSVNRAYADLVGFDMVDMLGAVPPFAWWAADWRPPTTDWSRETPYDRPYGGLFRHRKGHIVPVEILPFVVRDAEGAPARTVALVTSLSERHEFARQLAQSGKLAALGELAAGVAHEINNPLFAILGLVEFLVRDTEPGTKAYERLTLIQSTGNEIKEIVRALLDFAREPTDDFVEIFLRDIVHDSVDLLRRTTSAKSVEIVESYSGDPRPVLASPNQLKQIVLNLVTNAQQAMPDGGTMTIEVTSGPDMVTASFSDTGPGIDPEILTRVFEPFFTTKRNSGGTGLGLAVSHGIAEMHSGRLTVESTPGKGATFRLRLPVHREP
ncbi:MAG: two-component system, sporulation sensor kinase [Gaiellaceae bacterium]|jgi:two-component system NtrC family sensor kinase|nr:two-component system, sporulation sensor kinase [Gaiellaceae bacterium]